MFEISLPRKETSLGVGHKDFEVEFDHTLSIGDDIGRRDFTINAMAERVSDSLIFSDKDSMDDLSTRRLRVLHEGSAREDPLRILRALRFISKLDCEVEHGTDLIMRESVHLLEHVSAERLQDELLKVLTGSYVDKALRYAQEIGVFRVILPELEGCVGVVQNHYHSFDVFEHTVQVVKFTESEDPYVKLAALFHDIAKPAVKWIGSDGVAHFYDPMPGQTFSVEPRVKGNHEDVGADMAYRIMSRLRFSEAHAKRVSILVRNHMFIQGENLRGQSARKLLARLDGAPGDLRDNVDALFAIRYGDISGGKAEGNEHYVASNKKFYEVVSREIDKESAFKTKDLDIDGMDIMSLGVPQGPKVGKVLNSLLERVVEDPELNNREYLLREAKSLLSA